MSNHERGGEAMDEAVEVDAGAAQPQGASARRLAPPPAVAWAAGWLATLALPLWMARLSAVWLVVAGLGALVWSWSAARRSNRWALVAAGALWLAVGIGAGVQWRLAEVARAWPSVQRQIEETAATTLNEALDDLVVRGERAVAGTAALAGAGAGARSSELFAALRALEQSTGVTALALFDPAGVPVAWAGEHRGLVPLQVRYGTSGYIFHEGPLFSYLYFARRLEGGSTAVAAVLLESNLRVEEGRIPFAEWFAGRHGLMPRFSDPARASPGSVWDWSTDRPILSVTFAALTQQHWWERIVARGRGGVGLATLASLLLLSAAWYRRRRRRTPGVPVAMATLAAVVAPVDQVLGTERLFDPLQFLLPVPVDVTLGLLLIVLVGTSVWLLTRSDAPPLLPRLPLPLRAVLAAALFPVAVRLADRSSSPGILAAEPGGGLALQLAITLLLAVPLFLLLRTGPAARERRALGQALIAGGVLLPLAIGLAAGLRWHPEHPVLPWSALAWGVPFALVAAGLARVSTWHSRLRIWLLAGWLAGTASVSHLWILHSAAELGNAERELARLGTEPDPFLDFLLRQFAERARSFAVEGEEGINLLYHSWVASGLAERGYEARLTIWRDGRAEEELRLSEQDSIPPVVAERVAALGAAVEPRVEQFDQTESLHYLLLVPFPDGEVVTVAVPPRRQLGRSTALARFLHPESEVEAAAGNETLFLVPEEPGADGAPAPRREVSWTRTETGWRSEARAQYPSGWMHAHLFVRTPGLGMVLVKALLALAFILGVLVALWLAARVLCGEVGGLPVARRQWVRSFRGRLTLTLFAFFLLPTATFGAVAYGAVAREVLQSAAGLARQALEQAAPAAERRLTEVGSQARADLLLYRNGLLVDAAAPEVLELGLFDSWLPPDVFLDFSSGEDTHALEERRLGANNYLVAYRRLDPGSVLAAPIPLASGEARRRQEDFRDLLLLVSLLGAALSVMLALLASRTLSRPIDELTRASATVGAGNLRVRLPESRQDEFGGVYRSFNRMVGRLRKARAALVQETRRTETIVAEAATGVLALDSEGRVELVNPRASEILGTELRRAELLPRSNASLEALAEGVDQFRRSGTLEAGREIEVDGRILRLRLRRLTGSEGLRGTVVALEDVTSEIRTARVLAWGEMAQQVAHEIKNPLTPIKLAVQHVRRAFADQRQDFGQILERNVEAILQEIDRLGEIARAFSRFGTPQAPDAPLEEVELTRAVEETMALYRSGGGGIEYQVDLEAVRGVRVTGRMGELKEVLVNLLENARDALDGSGTVGIAASLDTERRRAALVVWDTGEGIPQELLARVFEPHFSTRTSGTGLGLAIVRRMVESWGGEVDAESRAGAGTRVRLRLPVADARAQRASGA